MTTSNFRERRQNKPVNSGNKSLRGACNGCGFKAKNKKEMARHFMDTNHSGFTDEYGRVQIFQRAPSKEDADIIL